MMGMKIRSRKWRWESTCGTKCNAKDTKDISFFFLFSFVHVEKEKRKMY